MLADHNTDNMRGRDWALRWVDEGGLQSELIRRFRQKRQNGTLSAEENLNSLLTTSWNVENSQFSSPESEERGTGERGERRGQHDEQNIRRVNNFNDF